MEAYSEGGFEDTECGYGGDCLFECVQGMAVVGAGEVLRALMWTMACSITWRIRLMPRSAFFATSSGSPLEGFLCGAIITFPTCTLKVIPWRMCSSSSVS